MTRVNEFTPLLVADDQFPVRRTSRRRSVWQYVLAGALSLGVLSFFHQNSIPINVIVSLDKTPSADVDDVAFLSAMETFMDPSVDPCVDFYTYACGGWLKTHEIPSDRPSIDSSFYVVSETNKDTIQHILDQNPPQIGQLYHSCLNAQEVDANGVTFVTQLIETVHQVNSTLALMTLAGEMDQFLGISTFFSIFVGADPKDPSTNVLQLAQGGLTLPSREYYLEDSKVDAFAALYVDYVTKLFAVGNLDNHNVSEYAEGVLETETAFAKISLSNAALRDPWATNTAYPFAEIATRYPFVMAYLNGIYKQEPFPMLHAIIATPDFFEAQNELLSDESLLPQLKNYVSFHLIDSFGAILGEYFRQTSHEFHGKIQGAGALLPRDQYCVRLTSAFLGDELGTYYMQDVFGPDAKASAEALVAEIEESLKALLLTESWLDKVTYDAAVEKLDKVKNYIGGPDDVPPLPFELQADAFFNNVKNLMQLSAAGTIQAIGKPVDKQAWDMSPSTVNAYYDPSANKMVFPAAILQPPFYSADHFPAAANFARIGMVMGHELSHGFDDQGRNYDGNGALRSWWTPSVSTEFAEKAQCLAAQYSTFPVVSIEDGHVLGTVNGNLTLGENIADNGGIHLAYEAYHLWKSTFVPPVIVPPTEVPPETSSPPAEPMPEPTETGPGEQIPVTLPPEPAQSEPSGDIPVVTPSQPPVVPEPRPTDIGPGEVVPDEAPATEQPLPEAQTPVPTETEPTTEVPIMTPPPVPTSDVPPTPPDVPDTPTPPNVPDIPTPPIVPTVAPPTIIPPPQPEPSDVTPDKTPKHKHKKETEEPSVEPNDKEKHHKSESDKDKQSDKSGSKEEGEKSHKHSSDDRSEEKDDKQDEKKSEEGKHSHEKRDDKDDKDKLRKEHDKGNEGDTKEQRRHHKDESTSGEDSKKHKKHSDEDKEKDESEKHRHKNSDRDEYEGKRHHEKREEEDHRDKHEHRKHESKHDRHDDHHRRDEERDEKEDRHEDKHHGHGEDVGHDEENVLHNHHKHAKKEERREERKERKEHKQGKKADEVFEGKHHNDRDGDYDVDRTSRHHEKHHRHEEEREERWGECGDCRREKHKHHHRHHHKHEEDWDKEWKHHGCGEEEECGKKHHKWELESKYPFSGGDAKIHSMIQKLARAIVQPNDPVADDRLFFTAFAQNWCEKRTPGYAELLRMIDPHSPGKWRVNGPLMNYDKFAEVFSCPVGTPMNPEKKCVIW